MEGVTVMRVCLLLPVLLQIHVTCCQLRRGRVQLSTPLMLTQFGQRCSQSSYDGAVESYHKLGLGLIGRLCRRSLLFTILLIGGPAWFIQNF